ncbi:MAG: WecB/TagA/CpsF family glycosyltransferase [Candidatus Firestonebacteria bacterium]
MKKLSLLGVRVDDVSLEEIKSISLSLIAGQKPSMFVSLGSLTVMQARKDQGYKALIDEAELVICDGSGVSSAIKYLTGEKIRRIAGVDLVPFFAELSEEKSCKLFLLGAEEDVIKKAADLLKKRFPGANICGYLNGYFDIINSVEVISTIKKASPDILLVGLGQPLQEKWLKDNLKALSVPVTMGVGGSFDVIAGKFARAPVVFRKSGLEWLFRMIIEPCRIKRNFALIGYVFLIIKNKFRGGKE